MLIFLQCGFTSLLIAVMQKMFGEIFMSEKIWATLVHLGTNLWYEQGNTCGQDENRLWKSPASPDIRFDRAVWDEYLTHIKKNGVNTIILDVGEALIYKSHPEISCRGAWSHQEMRDEIKRLNDMGIDVIPKLNFSTCHDEWLGVYSRMVSTPTYYQVCKDLICEVCDLFSAKYLHIGFDEEVYENQKKYDFVVIRQNDLWWNDLNFFNECVRANGARAMMWSDYARHKPQEFVQKCPKDIVQCVWYYFDEFGKEGSIDPQNEIRLRPIDILQEAGFDQLPTGSIEYFKGNFEALVKYCKQNVSDEHLLGFMQTTWESVTPEWREYLNHSTEPVKSARDWFEDINS